MLLSVFVCLFFSKSASQIQPDSRIGREDSAGVSRGRLSACQGINGEARKEGRVKLNVPKFHFRYPKAKNKQKKQNKNSNNNQSEHLGCEFNPSS